jgi:hypothetical protein
MIDEQALLDDFRAMDETRQRQMAIAIKALAAQYPRTKPTRLSLVRPVSINDGLREGLQNYK